MIKLFTFLLLIILLTLPPLLKNWKLLFVDNSGANKKPEPQKKQATKKQKRDASAEFKKQKQAQTNQMVNAKKVELGEAIEILNLPRRPSVREIRDAHRRMIQKNHPDIGGSKYIASKINWARDVLIKEAA